MKAVHTLLTCLALSTTGWAQSAETPPPTTPTPEDAPIPMQPEGASDESLGVTIQDEEDFDTDLTEPPTLLATVRATKRYGVGMRYGLFVAPVPALGLEAFYQLRPELQLGLTHVQGSQDLKNHLAATDGTTTEKHVLSADLTLLYARYFVGDSWYLTGALGQRVVKTEYELRSTTVNSSLGADNTATSTVLTVAIGNMWTWDKGFYAAIDWIGYSLPVSSKEDVDSNASGSAAPPAKLEKKRQDVEDIFKDTGKLGTWLYLGFHLGYTF